MDLDLDEKIRMQFRKAQRKGYADNFTLESRMSEPGLERDEECLVRIDCEDGSQVYLTNKAILSLRDNKRVEYKDIKNIYWQSEKPDKSKNLAKERRDIGYIIIKKIDGRKEIIRYLGNAYQPCIQALEAIIEK